MQQVIAFFWVCNSMQCAAQALLEHAQLIGFLQPSAQHFCLFDRIPPCPETEHQWSFVWLLAW